MNASNSSQVIHETSRRLRICQFVTAVDPFSSELIFCRKTSEMRKRLNRNDGKNVGQWFSTSMLDGIQNEIHKLPSFLFENIISLQNLTWNLALEPIDAEIY